jgi:hypothetical protein
MFAALKKFLLPILTLVLTIIRSERRGLKGTADIITICTEVDLLKPCSLFLLPDRNISHRKVANKRTSGKVSLMFS